MPVDDRPFGTLKPRKPRVVAVCRWCGFRQDGCSDCAAVGAWP